MCEWCVKHTGVVSARTSSTSWCNVPACESDGAHALPHVLAASSTYGCSLMCVRSQPQSPTVSASIMYGCSLKSVRLQPQLHTVAASSTCGSRLCYIRLQAMLHTVAGYFTYGCRLCYIRLQAMSHTVAGVMLRLKAKIVGLLDAGRGATAAQGCNRMQQRL